MEPESSLSSTEPAHDGAWNAGRTAKCEEALSWALVKATKMSRDSKNKEEIAYVGAINLNTNKAVNSKAETA